MKPYEAICEDCIVLEVCKNSRSLSMAQGVLRLIRTSSSHVDIEQVSNLNPEEIEAVEQCVESRSNGDCILGGK